MTLQQLAQAAYQQAYKVYDEAITSRDKIDILVASIPLDNPQLYQRLITIQDTFIQAINAAWDAQNAAEKLMEDIGEQ